MPLLAYVRSGEESDDDDGDGDGDGEGEEKRAESSVFCAGATVSYRDQQERWLEAVVVKVHRDARHSRVVAKFDKSALASSSKKGSQELVPRREF